MQKKTNTGDKIITRSRVTAKHVKIFSDGGSRGNPGPAACGFVVLDFDDKKIFSGGESLGITTNNVAEYSGVIKALEWVIKNREELRISAIDYFLDSELVVKQLNGEYKIRDLKLQKLAGEVRGQVSELGVEVKFQHVRREKNKEADSVLNKILDGVDST